MATTLAEILSDLRTEAAQAPRNDPGVAADARRALSRLRPALDRLRDDGLDTGASIDVDPDAFSRQADRVHWVRLLARTCDTLGELTPESDGPGRLTDLADAAAVAATLHADALSSSDRWAIVTGFARTARHLIGPAGSSQETAATSRALIVAEASSGVLFQFASLDPPTVQGNVAMDRPVPNPSAMPANVVDAALEASARLVYTTRPGALPLAIADILAIATAAETTCRYVERAQSSGGEDPTSGRTSGGARAWSSFRQQLAPFNDGSRRPHNSQPPAVHSALMLHRALSAGSVVAMPPEDVAPLATILDRLTSVAAHLDAAIVSGITGGRFVAYAVDLPVREARVSAFLEGRRAGGLVTADAGDLSPVRTALNKAYIQTGTLASGLGGRSEPGATSAQLGRLSHPRVLRPHVLSGDSSRRRQ